MKRSILSTLQEFFKKRSSKPWASFETDGPGTDGRLEFSISWNNAFIARLQANGYSASTEEEMVQMFFLSTQMLPESMLGEEEDDSINPDATPNLTSEANVFRK